MQCEGPYYGVVASGGLGDIPRNCSDYCGLSAPAGLGNQTVLGLSKTGVRGCLASLGIVGKKSRVKSCCMLNTRNQINSIN